MIFMQQKHFNNPRIYSNHRTSRTTSNRTTPNRRQPIQYEQHPITNITNDSDTRPRSSFKLNQKLTSIGAFFGTLSIVITGVLLYAIFTAESQDKWYYISAVLINVSLLLFIMIGAILFDRYFVKKYPQTTSLPTTQTTTSHSLVNPTNRIVNATLYPVNPPYIQNSLIVDESINSIDCLNNEEFRARNDVPPQYPDVSTFINLNDKELIKDSRRVTLISDETNKTQVKLDSPLNPPNYFDLYPSNKNDTPNEATSSMIHL